MADIFEVDEVNELKEFAAQKKKEKAIQGIWDSYQTQLDAKYEDIAKLQTDRDAEIEALG
jgi:hypothetical protein